MKLAALLLSFSACFGAEQASLEGVTVNGATGAPLSGVHVRLLPAEYQKDPGGTVSVAYGVVSDGAGRFSMIGVPPGSYILAPERSGFMYILEKAEVGNRTVVLKPGDHITGSRLAMTPRAAIRGRVTDEYGDPVEDAWVCAWPVSTDAERILLSGSLANSMPPLLANSTNDRGEFRIVAMPGKYRVQATEFDEANRNALSEAASDGGCTDRAATYYPSATTAEQARVVEVAAGADVRGIDIRLVPPQPPQSYRAVALGGIVTGTPADSAGLTVRLESVGSGFWGQTSVGGDGRFLFSGLRPGHYQVAASCCSSVPRLASMPVDIQLDNGDRTGLVVALQAGGELSGTLEMGGSLRGFDVRKRTVELGFADASGVDLSPMGGEVGEGGAFRIGNVPPRRLRVRVHPLPDNVYIKSVSLNGAEAAGSILDLSGGVPRSRLTVTVDLGGALAGKVLTKDGGPLVFQNAGVLLIPENLAAGGEEMEFQPGDRITRNLTISEKGDADAQPKRQQ